MIASESLTTIFCVSVVAVWLAACSGSEASDRPTGPEVGPTAEEAAAGSAMAVAMDAAKATAAADSFAAGGLTMRSVVERLGDGVERPVYLSAVPGGEGR